MTKLVLVVGAMLTSLYAGCLVLFNARVPEAYMDEIFHVPQTQTYCQGGTEWDDKITTLPGLYLIAVPYARFTTAVNDGAKKYLKFPSSYFDGCTVATLRSINVVFAFATFCLLYWIFAQQRQVPPLTALLHALTLALSPVHFFFSFLYYTDCASTFTVLLCYYFAQPYRSSVAKISQTSILLSAVAGAVAVLCRQTNAIWVSFILGTTMVREFEQTHGRYGSAMKVRLPFMLLMDELGVEFASSTSAADGGGDCCDVGEEEDSGHFPSNMLLAIVGLLRFAATSLKEFRRVLGRFWPWVVVVVAFAVFVVVNGGVVIGDRQNHALVFHFAQIPYFFMYAVAPFSTGALLALPAWLEACYRTCSCSRSPSQKKNSSHTSGRSSKSISSSSSSSSSSLASCVGLFVLTALATAAVAMLLMRFSPAHPFLLADNRHYPFYLWRYFFLRHRFCKLLPMPLYMFAVWLVKREMGRYRSVLWLSIFSVALCLNLLPTHLVEFRYFTVPFLMVHLNVRPQPHAQTLVTLLVFIAVNAATIYIFLFKDFKWPDGSTARFMW